MRLICAIRTQAFALSMDCSQFFSGPPQPCEGVLHNLSSRQNLEALAVSDRFTILMVQRPMPISASRGFGPGHHDLRSLSQTNRIITRRSHLTHFRSGSQSSKISDGLAMVWRCVSVTGCRGRHGSLLWRHQWGVRSRVRAAAGRHPSKGSFDDRRGGRTLKPACFSVRPMISKTKSRQAAASINRVRS